MSSTIQSNYIFVPGKNWKLSLAELASFLEARGYLFEISSFSDAFLDVRLHGKLEPPINVDLGGILKIGEILAKIPTERIVEFFQESISYIENLKSCLPLSRIADDLTTSRAGKILFGVSIYFEEHGFRSVSNELHRFVGSSLKEELRRRGKKSIFMGFPRDRKLPQLSPIEVLKKGFVESKSEVLFCVGKNWTWVGRTIDVHNPLEFQKRDIGKPVQRRIFGISPRVAKILLNLAQCMPNKVVLDPFCGVGTVLLEALLMNAKVIGVDINPWCLEATRTNLEWLKREYSLSNTEITLQSGDARKLPKGFEGIIDCIATEPDLGPALRQVPTVSYANRIQEKLRPLFQGFLTEAHTTLKQGGRLAIVTPYIKTRSEKPALMNIEQAATALGFKTINPFKREIFDEENKFSQLAMAFPLSDVEERHIVGREIHVFQK